MGAVLMPAARKREDPAVEEDAAVLAELLQSPEHQGMSAYALGLLLPARPHPTATDGGLGAGPRMDRPVERTGRAFAALRRLEARQQARCDRSAKPGWCWYAALTRQAGVVAALCGGPRLPHIIGTD
jgi:hypothetical protein